MTEIDFKWESVYEQVWQTHITQLGRGYGLSDIGLLQICMALNVPLTPRRFWAKCAVGKNMRRQHCHRRWIARIFQPAASSCAKLPNERRRVALCRTLANTGLVGRRRLIPEPATVRINLI
jgi:hypothetical protein